VIRTAEASDVSAIEALMTSVPRFRDDGWPQDLLGRVLGSPGTIAPVRVDGRAVNGFVCAHDVGFRAYLSELVVWPDSQRRGIGVEPALGGRAAPLRPRMPPCDCRRLGRRAFYRAQGWAPPSAVLMRKRLPTVAHNACLGS
jgi:GNAT superfamily N-acetyltransferase